MKPTLIALAVLGLAVPAHAADTYGIDPAHTLPSYEINHMGFSTQRGHFNAVTGKLVLDRAARSGSVDITIDAASINTGNPKQENHLRSEDFFNVDKYPTITFKSTRLNFSGDNVVGADGAFTLLGVTKPLTLSVANFKCGANPMVKKDECGGDVTVTIKRSDFGMTKFIPAVGDEVKLLIPVEAFKE